MGLNRVCVVGRVTREPEYKFTDGGVAMCTFGIAVDRFTKDQEGKYDVDFFNVIAWRKTAEFVHQYLGKGRLISLDGRLQQRRWIDQQSGQKHSVVEIVAESVQGLDKRPNTDGQDPAASQPLGDNKHVTGSEDEDPFAGE